MPYLLCRCSNMANGVTLPKPRSGSSSALRNNGLTAFKIWAVSTASRLLHSATSLRASVYARRATEMAAAVLTATGGGPGCIGIRKAIPTRAM